MPTIMPLSEFSDRSKDLVKEVNESGAPLYLTEDGRATAVVMSYEAYEQARNSQAMLKVLTLREEQADESEDVDFDQIMDEIDHMIEAHNGQ